MDFKTKVDQSRIRKVLQLIVDINKVVTHNLRRCYEVLLI